MCSETRVLMSQGSSDPEVLYVYKTGKKVVRTSVESSQGVVRVLRKSYLYTTLVDASLLIAQGRSLDSGIPCCLMFRSGLKSCGCSGNLQRAAEQDHEGTNHTEPQSAVGKFCNKLGGTLVSILASQASRLIPMCKSGSDSIAYGQDTLDFVVESQSHEVGENHKA